MRLLSGLCVDLEVDLDSVGTSCPTATVTVMVSLATVGVSMSRKNNAGDHPALCRMSLMGLGCVWQV